MQGSREPPTAAGVEMNTRKYHAGASPSSIYSAILCRIWSYSPSVRSSGKGCSEAVPSERKLLSRRRLDGGAHVVMVKVAICIILTSKRPLSNSVMTHMLSACRYESHVILLLNYLNFVNREKHTSCVLLSAFVPYPPGKPRSRHYLPRMGAGQTFNLLTQPIPPNGGRLAARRKVCDPSVCSSSCPRFSFSLCFIFQR